MASALVSHPCIGSVWLEAAKIEDGYVIGEVLDCDEVGHPNLPEDYLGQYVTMHFSISCVRKWEGSYGDDARRTSPVVQG